MIDRAFLRECIERYFRHKRVELQLRWFHAEAVRCHAVSQGSMGARYLEDISKDLSTEVGEL